MFLALKPSFDANEDLPRIGSSFEEWDGFYRARFDELRPDLHFLYKRYQALGEYAVGPSFRLGIDAIVLEVVRFKRWKGSGIDDPGVLDHERLLLKQLLEDISPRLIICQTTMPATSSPRCRPSSVRLG